MVLFNENGPMRASKRIEKVQLVPPWSTRSDRYVIKFAGWPQPPRILSVGTYIKQNNPGVKVEILNGNNVVTLDEVKRMTLYPLLKRNTSIIALSYRTAYM